MTTPWPITFDDVLAAQTRLSPFLQPTPLRRYAALDEALGMRVLLKHEVHQPTCAFKIRNGVAGLTAMSDAQRQRGVITASTGNHGQGVALAGQWLGVKVIVLAPVGTNPAKLQAMRGFGAEVIEFGDDFDASIAESKRRAAETGMTFIHGVDHPMMPAGAGTMTLEILEQCDAMNETPDAVLIAVGGGSQAVGAMTVLREKRPDIKVIGVQAAGAPTIHDSWHARQRLEGDPPRTFAEGVATRSTYDLTFDALQAGLDDFVLVTDDEMAAAMRLIARAAHHLVEPAGAASTAALSRDPLRTRFAGRTVVAILCGANVSQQVLQNVMTQP